MKRSYSMATEAKPSLTPDLRFPGFQDQPWEEKKVGDFLQESRTKGSAGDVARKLTVKLWGKGVFEKVESLSGSENTQYYRRAAGQFIYSKLDFLNQAFGVIPAELDGLESTVDLPCFDISKKLHPHFLLEYVKRPAFYEKFGEIADGGRKAKRIQAESFLSFPILVPAKFDEQQKIAECLSTLDELIGAEGQKLDALKAHKKGLMQQLFPRAGETLPRLRFPEFQIAPEWERHRLAEKATILKGKGISKADIDSNGPLPCIRYGELYTYYKEIIQAVASRTSVPAAELFLSKSNDVVIPSSGETKIDIATASCVLLDGVALGGDLNVIRSELNGPFLSYYLNGPKKFDIAKVAQGDAVVHLYPYQLEKLEIFSPSPAEQHRIATYLSSLDELIAAQSDKLEALKPHKKGLMQQLFPLSVESAE